MNLMTLILLIDLFINTFLIMACSKWRMLSVYHVLYNCYLSQYASETPGSPPISGFPSDVPLGGTARSLAELTMRNTMQNAQRMVEHVGSGGQVMFLTKICHSGSRKEIR